jgi:acyl-[acyl-carrier-protein] desaturase
MTDVPAVDVLTELAPKARELVDRHLANAREWFPHEFVPWSRGRDFAPGEAWAPDQAPMDEAVRSALFVNLLTEDNLPHYYWTIDRTFGGRAADVDEVWSEWTRRWTAEEGRHSIVIRDYLTITRAVDPVALERGRMVQVSDGRVPQFDSPTEGLVYVTLQEMATRISHANTGRMMSDDVGSKIMAKVAGDENLHHIFYRDITSALLELDPSATVLAIDHNVRTFEMPGTGIPDFKTHAAAIASAGIYDFAAYHDQILEPIVLGTWDLANVTGLSPEAEEARERCINHIARLGEIVRRRAARREARLAKVSVSS